MTNNRSSSRAMLIRNTGAVMSGAKGAGARLGRPDIRIRDGIITEIAPGLEPQGDEQVLDARGGVVYPGWINTHHHLDQEVMKAIPEGMNDPLKSWLSNVPYPRISHMTDELQHVAAQVGMAELLLSGATGCADHHYLYHSASGNDSGDIFFETAAELGLRFALCRGGTIGSGKDHAGFANSGLVPESFEQMAGDIDRLASKYHQNGKRPMRRVVVAPTTPTYSQSPEVLRDLGEFARGMGLHMHSHLSEDHNYAKYCLEKHGCLPVEFAAEHGWVGPDVWFAHMVHIQPEEMRIMSETGTGISHCPVSNCRLGSGIAPIQAYDDAGVTISLGVDGVASNESGSMTGEANLVWLIHRGAQCAADATTVENVIHWGTMGGARVLGLEDVGQLAVGKAADLVIYELDHPRFMGFHDIATAPVAAGEPVHIRASIIDGRIVVEDDRIPGLDLEALRHKAGEAVDKLRVESL